MDIKTAIKPNRFHSLSDIPVPQDVKTEEEVADKSEELLHGLSYHAGWEVLEKSIRDQINDLETMALKQIEHGASWEEIGKTTVVLQICKDELLKIINKVTDAKEAVESRERENSGSGDRKTN